MSYDKISVVSESTHPKLYSKYGKDLRLDVKADFVMSSRKDNIVYRPPKAHNNSVTVLYNDPIWAELQ